MAFRWLFLRPPGFGSPPESEPTPGLLDLWEDAPDVDAVGIWDRVAAELGEQDRPPTGPRLRILLFPQTRLQFAGAAASILLAAMISGLVIFWRRQWRNDRDPDQHRTLGDRYQRRAG